MRGGPWLALRSAPRSPERAYLALPLGGAPNLVGVVSLASRFEGGGGRAEHGELELLVAPAGHVHLRLFGRARRARSDAQRGVAVQIITWRHGKLSRHSDTAPSTVWAAAWAAAWAARRTAARAAAAWLGRAATPGRADALLSAAFQVMVLWRGALASS